jgi:hypothetical protein
MGAWIHGPQEPQQGIVERRLVILVGRREIRIGESGKPALLRQVANVGEVWCFVGGSPIGKASCKQAAQNEVQADQDEWYRVQPSHDPANSNRVYPRSE